MATDTKSHVVVASTPTPTDPESNNPEHNVSTWERIREIYHSSLLGARAYIDYRSWATFGYFIRLLDSSNITNAYVSGMKEDLDIKGNEYNLLQTFFTCGYLVGQIPSQILLTRIRPSIYLPAAELLWTIITFCFASVQNTRTVFALRFILGMLESPFAVGVLTIMGSWYTPQELSKRIAIFYSASYAASMFSGYLQAAIYRGLDGVAGLAGWRWLFIFCGLISVWGPLWGFYAVPDNPYSSKARWMPEEEKKKHVERMQKIERREPERLTLKKLKKIVTHWPLYVFIFALICHCVVTQPLNYFSVWLKSLNQFSVYQINLFPTAAQALGLVTTLAYSWLSDGLNKRWQILVIPATINFVGMVIVAVGPGYGATFFGYLINAASWGFWPVLYAWAIELMSDDMEERAIVIGVAQTFGQAFIAWVPVLILDVGKYAPKFTMGFSVMCGISVLQFASIFIIKFVSERYGIKRKHGNETLPADSAESDVDKQSN
ncbi:unnamed protein product [Clonostachys rosea f. rosea IK726]|uniref:Uncharacterized protein n=1 Tax=Clonostachys rosea f. rosea IK726 TaxID=1349383 RepID=A0ACA9TXJ3_BIOOC|nr:unnamed protein product [Clonostachys rosea f. rosea IK726]